MSQVANNRNNLRNQFHHPQKKLNKFLMSNKTQLHGEKHAHRENIDNGKLAYGSTISFTLGLNDHGEYKYINNEPVIVIKLSAISGLSGGSYNRFVENLACSFFSEIEIKNNSERIIFFNDPQEIYQLLLLSYKEDEWNKLKSDLGFGTISDRNTAAGSASRYILPLRFIKMFIQRKFPHFLLPNDLEFRFKIISSISSLIETDHNTGTALVNINDIYMDVEYMDDKSASDFEKQDKNIKVFYNLKPHKREITVSDGSTSIEASFSEFQNHNILFITLALLSDTDKDNYNNTNYVAIDKYKLDDNGNNIHGSNYSITKEDYQQIYLSRYKPLNYGNLKGNNLYIIYFGDNLSQDMYPYNPNKFDNYSHELTHARYFTENKVKLRCEWESAISGAHTLVVTGYEIQKVLINNAGNLEIV